MILICAGTSPDFQIKAWSQSEYLVPGEMCEKNTLHYQKSYSGLGTGFILSALDVRNYKFG